jgi:hypothetical protein
MAKLQCVCDNYDVRCVRCSGEDSSESFEATCHLTFVVYVNNNVSAVSTLAINMNSPAPIYSVTVYDFVCSLAAEWWRCLGGLSLRRRSVHDAVAAAVRPKLHPNLVAHSHGR